METGRKIQATKNPTRFPKVSIGLPTFNSHGSVLKTLRSIRDQRYPNLEVIISDNCSSDDTQEICLDAAREFTEIRYFRQEKNIGLVPNFEFVLKEATGDFFMWVADDDTLELGILRKYVEFLNTHPDYSLVSGQIKYWLGDQVVYCEKEMSLEDASRNMRVFNYYFKVMYGALFHGLMYRQIAERIPLRNAIGNDFHFVASLAYVGKVKHLDFVGYNKELNGTSRNSKHYAKVIGASWFAANFPRIAIAHDAFMEILIKSPVFAFKRNPAKVMLAFSCWAGILISYYCKKFPFIIAGSLKRHFWKPFGAKLSQMIKA